MEEQRKNSWFRSMLNKYDAFCKELGIDQGACRSCMPVVRLDEDKEQKNDNIIDGQDKL